MNWFKNLTEKISESKKIQFSVFFLVLLSLTCIMIGIYQPLCPGQDFHFHFQRFGALMEALDNGSYPIYLDYRAIDGYGYFTKAFYSDFILVPFAVIGNLTNAVFAYHFMLFSTTLLCGLFMYIAVNTIYKNRLAASVSAILYTFCTYRLLDVYHRAALGEALSFTFLPIAFLGLHLIIRGDYKKWYILAIGYSLMIYTHLISSVLMLITIVIFIVIYNKTLRKEPIRLAYLTLAALATAILTAYYSIPMLEQMMSADFYYETQQLTARAQDAKMQLHWIVWGLLGGGVQAKQIFIPGVGIVLTCCIALRLFVYEKSEELKSIDKLTLLGFIYIFAISVFFPWQIFPFNKLNFIQLPWRLYEFVAFFFAIAGGYYFSKALTTTKRTWIACLVLIAITSFIVINDGILYKDTRCLYSIDEKGAIHNKYHLGGLEYIPAKVPSLEYLHQRGDSVCLSNNDARIVGCKRQNNALVIDLHTIHETNLELPLIYYKGYKATAHGINLEVKESKTGLVDVKATKSGTIDVFYGGTRAQNISFWLSIISMIALPFYIFFNQLRKKKE